MNATATGRPSPRIPLLPQLIGLTLVAALAAEWALHVRLASFFPEIVPWLARYLAARAFAREHPWRCGLLALSAVGLLALLIRSMLLVWHNQVRSRIAGTYLQSHTLSARPRRVDVLGGIARRAAGQTFVGRASPDSLFGARTPVCVSEVQRSMHAHVIGKTGSGKTQSVLWPQTFQDILDGRGVLLIDAKGSDENLRTIQGMAAAANRLPQLRVFALPAWNRPGLFTHRYNLVHVAPRSASARGGDPVAMAERVFTALPLGDSDYYNGQARAFFVQLCRALHGMVDARGNGIPFNVRDVAACVKGAGSTSGFSAALKRVTDDSVERDAVLELQSQLERLGSKVAETLSGLAGALDQFLSPMVNAYRPDLVFEEVLEKSLIAYVQLPANLFPIQAPALGKVMLRDVQQVGGLRQVERRTRNQAPFSVTIDEFYTFADLGIVDGLNKLRDAHVAFTLCHQSIADLELVSKEFAQAVWDNTLLKHVLRQDSPELCERIARSIGTDQVVEHTVRRQEGALLTSLSTGDASSRLVEAYKLHPNAIKNLARAGQGYLVTPGTVQRVDYGLLPDLQLDVQLARLDQDRAPGLRLYEQCALGTANSPPPPTAKKGNTP